MRPVRSAKKSTRGKNPLGKVEKKPVVNEEMDDTETSVQETKLSYEPVVLHPVVHDKFTYDGELSPEFDMNVDPRIRHKQELKVHIATLDKMKKEREKIGKDGKGKLLRKEITAKMAEMEKVYKARQLAEVEKFLSDKTEEEISQLPFEQKKLADFKFKKITDQTRKCHKFGLSK